MSESYRSGRLCRWSVAAFAVAYGVALLALLTGTFGLYGQARDPLAGVFLVPLGWPWNLLIDRAPQAAWPVLAALAPAVNLALLALLCRWRAAKN